MIIVMIMTIVITMTTMIMIIMIIITIGCTDVCDVSSTFQVPQSVQCAEVMHPHVLMTIGQYNPLLISFPDYLIFLRNHGFIMGFTPIWDNLEGASCEGGMNGHQIS